MASVFALTNSQIAGSEYPYLYWGRFTDVIVFLGTHILIYTEPFLMIPGSLESPHRQLSNDPISLKTARYRISYGPGFGRNIIRFKTLKRVPKTKTYNQYEIPARNTLKP